MIACEKCGTTKEPYFRYWKDTSRRGFSAGSACPKCEPYLVGIQPEPWWWSPEPERLGGEVAR